MIRAALPRVSVPGQNVGSFLGDRRLRQAACVVVRFRDAGHLSRGSTSVAVTTQ